MTAAIAAGAGAAAATFAYAVRGKSSPLLAPSVWRGNRNRRTVALTFDDGPSESTPRILDVLARYGLRATFFQCGRNVTRLPGVARQVASAGHEIGNHSNTHPYLCFRSRKFILGELTAAQRVIEATLSVRPRLFRAPYGVRWFGLAEAQRQLALTGVMWTVLARDWVLPAPAAARRVLRHATAGAIVCLHDGRLTQVDPDIGETIKAVRMIVPVLLDRGLRFETAGELICTTI
jgi:peptidoglycan/xylan/chitin deacetylase (PgdA/CDA1 family)